MSVAASVIRTRTLSTFASSARSRWSSSSVSSCFASLSGAIRRGFLRLLEPSSTAPARRATVQRLSPRDLSHRLQRVDLADRRVRPKARDPRETHRVAGLVPIARLDLVERDLDHGIGHDGSDTPVVLNGVLEEVLRHLGDLLVGEPRVRLADIQKTIAVADRERVIGEHSSALAVAPLHRGHDDIERSQRPLHLEPLHAAAAWPVGRARVLDHEPFVAALACRSELAVEDPDQRLARRLDPLTLGEYHRRRDRQGAEDFLALVERGVKEGAPVALEDVERDEGRWELGAKLVRDVLPAQAGLKVGERHRLSLGEREHLAVDHVCAGNREEGRHQLRVTVGNAVERARVELDAVTGFVHLRADAVVLVLDDVWRRKALLDLVELQDRRREHHPDRKEVRERRLRERAVLRAQRYLSDISSQLVRSSDRLSLAPECARDGLLEESLA